MLRRAFPDMKFTTDLLFAEGDMVGGRWTGRGTHKGEFMGIPPSNKTFQMTGTDLLKIQNGKVVEWFHNEDVFKMLTDIGAIPQIGAFASAGGQQPMQPRAQRPT
jgi:predicted ester cyclase